MQKFPSTWSTKLNSANFKITRGFAFAAGAGASVLCGSFIVAANTVALSWSRSYCQAKRNDVPLVPTPELRDLAENVMEDFQLSKSEAASVNLFCSSLGTLDVFGSITSRFGALIGVPSFLLSKSTEEVVFNYRLDPSLTKEEMEIQEATYRENSLMSDSAKRYIIAEGLASVQNSYHFILPAAFASLGTALTLGGTSFLIRRLNLHMYSFLHRNFLYTITCSAFCVIALSALNKFNEYNLRNTVRRLDKEYIDGGIEYYEKLLARAAVVDNYCYISFSDNIDVWMLIGNFTRKLEVLTKRKEEFSKD